MMTVRLGVGRAVTAAALVLLGLSLTGCIEEERRQVKKDVCTEMERQNEEALAARDRANAGLTGRSRTPRVPLCLVE